METEVDVPNKDVQLAHKENVLTVPLLAIQRDDSGHTTVLVVDSQNHVHQRAVTLGIQGSLLAEVRSGLHENDRVVLVNTARYKDGEAITPHVESQPSNDVMHEEGGMTDAANEGGN
jgi:multidrug efflux pump subunit AcrA (membrane-fusion protein)